MTTKQIEFLETKEELLKLKALAVELRLNQVQHLLENSIISLGRLNHAQDNMDKYLFGQPLRKARWNKPLKNISE